MRKTVFQNVRPDTIVLKSRIYTDVGLTLCPLISHSEFMMSLCLCGTLVECFPLFRVYEFVYSAHVPLIIGNCVTNILVLNVSRYPIA